MNELYDTDKVCLFEIFLFEKWQNDNDFATKLRTF